MLGSFKMEYLWYVIIALILAVYAFTGFVLPRILEGILFYLAYSLTWLLLAVTALKISNLKNVKLWKPGNFFITMAAIIAVAQIATLVFTGIILGFGKSPYSFTPLSLILNITFFMSTLLGMELSRAYMVKTYCGHKPTLALGFIALLYATISVPLSRFMILDLNSPLELTEFSASTYLPALAESLLASYLALLAGPTPAIAYRGILQGFEWLCPILPNPSWSIKALVGVMIPAIGFLTIHKATMPCVTRKRGRPVRVQKPPLLNWTIVATLCVLVVWASTGLLGFRPSVISSGSMRPTINVGDIAITVKTPPEAIKIGDIIQYYGEERTIVHRVVNVQKEQGTKFFITQGDNNNVPDQNPVHPSQIVGKLVLTIPKFGWVSIAIKSFLTEAYTFAATNLTYASTTLAVTLAASVFGIRKYRNQPLRKLRRRLGR